MPAFITPPLSNIISTELLPFRIDTAQSEDDLQMACRARAFAYGKHLPEFGASMKTPDADDLSEDCTVLLAISKLDGSCLGTVRIQTIDTGLLRLEDSFQLPKALKQGKVAEISRLAIPSRANSLALRLMLIKAAYWLCRFNQVERIFFCVRYPVDRQYKRFDLEDVLPAGQFVPMKHIGMIAHRVLWFDSHRIENKWIQTGNPLHQVYFLTHHPDLLSNIQARALVLEEPLGLISNG